jgi:ribosomal protein S18 acetylase RimI-like enzyme
MVVERGEKAAGFFIDGLYPARTDLIDFAVHPSHRREGYGLRMISELVNKRSTHGRTETYADVRETI